MSLVPCCRLVNCVCQMCTDSAEVVGVSNSRGVVVDCFVRNPDHRRRRERCSGADRRRSERAVAVC